MSKNIWEKIKDNVRGVQGKFKRSYVPTTTPEEVALANQLKMTLPSTIATYIYVSGEWDTMANRALSGSVILSTDTPAEQNAVRHQAISSAYEAELFAMVDALSAIDLVKRQTGHFVLVTGLTDFVRKYNDFTLAQHFSELPERPTSTDRLYHDFVQLAATYQSLRVVAGSEKDKQQTNFVAQKLNRMLAGYRDSRGK